jgi:hypothetical protein
MDEEELEPDEFDPMFVERRGECDVALFFDVRWIHSLDREACINRTLAAAGASLQTSWAGYGAWQGAGRDYDALWQLFVTNVSIVRPFDFPEPSEPLLVVLLEAVRRRDIALGLPLLARAPAFTGHADVTLPSDMRTAVMRVIRWR